MIWEFYVWDDPELYTWSAATWTQAQAEICEDFGIRPDQIEAWHAVDQKHAKRYNSSMFTSKTEAV